MKSKFKHLIGTFLLLSLMLFSACSSDATENIAYEEVYGIEELSFGAYGTNAETSSSIARNNETLTRTEQNKVTYILPMPKTDGEMSVEQALANRRSQRNFQAQAITTEQLSQILWAAYGITSPNAQAPRGGLRTTPSAGALFPLEIYVVIGNVEGIEAGVYRYISEEHKMVRIIDGDIRASLGEAALRQRSVVNAPATIIYTAVFELMTARYGERGIMYTYIEVGHSAQNIYLQAEALGLGTVAVGAFTESRVAEILNLAEDKIPLYMMPIGYFYRN